MEFFGAIRIKWSYVTHIVDRSLIAGLQPMSMEPDSGALFLARVTTIGKHKEIEGTDGRKRTLFPGDVIAGVLGHRYATDQYEGIPVASGPTGHIIGIGGVCGEVTGRNAKMPDPTCLEWIGRLADGEQGPLYLRRFAIRPERSSSVTRARTLLVVGGAMNSGKTTTAAHAIRSLSGEGRRVAVAKLTGSACRKDLGIMEDAGATIVLDFTHCGHPSTAQCAPEDLFAIATDLRAALLAEHPEYIVLEIADGIFQRETKLLLEHAEFHDTVDAVLFAGGDSASSESGVRHLQRLGYNVVAVSGVVSNSRLGQTEVQATTGIPCLSGEMILAGALADALRWVGAA